MSLNNLSRLLREAEDGRWVTLKNGARIFITTKGTVDKRAETINRRLIEKKIVDKGFDEKAAWIVQAEFQGKISEIVPVNRENVINQIVRLPESHQKLIDKIVIENKPITGSFINKDNQIEKGLVSGRLETNQDNYETTLTVYPSTKKSYDEPREMRTVRHEVGHAVLNQLSTDNREEWKTLSDIGYYPNSYAATDSRENFAEHYRIFSDGIEGEKKIRAQTTPAQYKFLKRVFEKV